MGVTVEAVELDNFVLGGVFTSKFFQRDSDGIFRHALFGHAVIKLFN